MRKLMTAMSCAVLVLVGIGLGGCEAVPEQNGYKYPSADESVRPGSQFRQAGTDFLDDD
jgi:hypothetical protein